MADREKHISAIDGEPDIRAEQLTLDVGDIRSVKAANKEKKTEADIARETLRAMMGDEKNRKWFYALLTKCHILQNPFSRDPLLTAFSCGELNIGQQLFIQMHDACPELYFKMMDENNAKA